MSSSLINFFYIVIYVLPQYPLHPFLFGAVHLLYTKVQTPLNLICFLLLFKNPLHILEGL